MSDGSRGQANFATGFRLIAALLITVVAAAYSYHQRNVAKQLTAQNQALNATLNATRDQLSALTAKVNTLDEKPSPEKAKPPAGLDRNPIRTATLRHRIDAPRWKKLQVELDAQGKQIESTRQDLADTRTELQGSIAKTHDELVMLGKKGERNYYEFDLDKSRQFERQGPISIRLRKANTKHEFADLELLVDDFKLSKKHVNIYEPVIFYPGNDKLPVELVVNHITRNHIHGYVNEPKYKPGELEARADSGSNPPTGTAGGQATSTEAPARQRLPLPKN